MTMSIIGRLTVNSPSVSRKSNNFCSVDTAGFSGQGVIPLEKLLFQPLLADVLFLPPFRCVNFRKI